MKKKVVLLAVVVIIAALFFLIPRNKKESQVIIASDNGWDSQRFHNALAKFVVENAFDGYKVEFSTASTMMNWESMKTGDVDMEIESWTDNYPTYPENKAKGEVVDVGILVPDSSLGVYVLRYVVEGDKDAGIEPMAPGLRHVRDLKNYPQVFPDIENPKKGRIYGGVPGWVTDEIFHKKYQHYGLDQNFTYVRLGSEAALFAAIEAANNLHEAWVGYCWEPSSIAGKLPLLRLADEPYDEKDYLDGKTEFKKSELKIVSNPEFRKKVSPEVYSFFENYMTGSQGVSEALAYLEDNNATHEQTAVWFLKNNDDKIDEWLPAKNADRLRKHLATL